MFTWLTRLFASKPKTPTSADHIIESLESRPNDWHENTSTLSDSKTGTSLWLDHGFSGFSIVYPVDMGFNYLDKRRVWQAVHKWRDARISSLMKKEKH